MIIYISVFLSSARLLQDQNADAQTRHLHQTLHQSTPCSPSPDVSAVFQSHMTQVMPAIEDTFKKCMENYFQRQSSSTASSTPNLTQPSPAPSLMHELTGDIQQGNSATCDSNPLSASSVKTAINLTLNIDQKLRNEIHSGEYVKFASLLKPIEIDSEVRNNYQLWRKTVS